MLAAASRRYCSAVSRPHPLRFSLVGPGRVGSSLAHWACHAGARLDRVAGRDPARAAALAHALGGTAVGLSGFDSSGVDLLLISVADPALAGVVAELARRRQADVALHTAGAASAEVLAPLRAAGSAVGSLHPLKSFPRALPDSAEARGVVFGVDGDAAALRLGAELAVGWGARTVVVPREGRLLYHLAATLAAGGVVALLAAADRIARRAGLPEIALDGYLELARGSLEGAASARPVGTAITGPVARGERATVAAELAALESTAPELRPLVVELALATLLLLADADDARSEDRAALRRFLERAT